MSWPLVRGAASLSAPTATTARSTSMRKLERDKLSERERLIIMAASLHGTKAWERVQRANCFRVLQQALTWARLWDEERMRSRDVEEPTVDDWYQTLIMMSRMAKKERLIEGGGNLGVPNKYPPALPAFTSCGLTAKGKKVARALFARFPKYRLCALPYVKNARQGRLMEEVTDAAYGPNTSKKALRQVLLRGFVEGQSPVWERTGSWLRPLIDDDPSHESFWLELATHRESKVRFRVAYFIDEMPRKLANLIGLQLCKDRSKKVRTMAQARLDDSAQ
ncbi:hypothetical protein AYO40_02695 [Planctomycetaceae bacterium SCGC AG-212-D15]|nr:hypothetical protein AYO40_02695 [Planctomycetaceae bacterium SCGC AG-212-D15]